MNFNLQMGNLGSAVVGALYYKGKVDKTAIERLRSALELFDFTLRDKRWSKDRKDKVLKIKFIFCDTFFGLGNFKVSPKSIEQYFIPFAIKANSER